MKLLIVIPALNEEQSIESIILRTHAAKEYILKKGAVTSVVIVVVSDGSTDNTVKIASMHTDKIKLIIFEKNRGYGAAIKAGWDSEPSADLLGFIDADGTCEPNFFSDLCDIAVNENADMVVGSRLNKNSEMPLIRRVGNTVFSILLSLVSEQRVKDTASGMRLIRRTALTEIMPLPDGLNFTPAMSARAILCGSLKIVEKDMPYSEREGESKLDIWKDGKKFLAVILENIFLYVPFRVYNLVAVIFLLFACAIMLNPVLFYISRRYLEDWMIYRFIVADVTGIIGTLLLSMSSISRNVVYATVQSEKVRKKTLLFNIFEHPFSIVLSGLFFLIGTLLIVNSIWHRIRTGLTNEHWSRYISMIFFYVTGAIIMLTFLANRILNLVRERMNYLKSKK
ncbi:MAG: glycosyltransferase family 2 protein [Bacteroidia bacterium]